MLNGSGTIKLDGNYRFICDKFIDNVSEYSNLEWGGDYSAKIKCQITFVNDKPIFNTLPETEYQLDEVNKYVGNIKLSKVALDLLKINLIHGKHFINNVLVYEGEFKNWEYSGSGIKFHPNGNLNISGTFDKGDAISAEYYDENGNLIFSDVNEYNDMPALAPASQPFFQLPSIPLLSNPPPIFSAMLGNSSLINGGASLAMPDLIQNLVNSINNLSNQNNLNAVNTTVVQPPNMEVDENESEDIDSE